MGFILCKKAKHYVKEGPYVRVSNNGHLFISGFLMKQFVSPPKFILFLIEKEHRIVCIKPCEKGEDAYPIRYFGKTDSSPGSISCRSALRRSGIDFSESSTFKAYFHDNSVQINLDEKID